MATTPAGKESIAADELAAVEAAVGAAEQEVAAAVAAVATATEASESAPSVTEAPAPAVSSDHSGSTPQAETETETEAETEDRPEARPEAPVTATSDSAPPVEKANLAQAPGAESPAVEASAAQAAVAPEPTAIAAATEPTVAAIAATNEEAATAKAAQAVAPEMEAEEQVAAEDAVEDAAEDSAEDAADEPNALERFASGAQSVADSAMDKVTATIQSVSDVIAGDDEETVAAAPLAQSAEAIAEAATPAQPESAAAPEPLTVTPDSSRPQARPTVPDAVATLMRQNPNKALLVLFWEPSATSPTSSAFEWLARMQSRYGQQGLATVAVNVEPETSASSARQIAHHRNVEHRHDPERILARDFWVQALPSAYLIDAEGNMVRRMAPFDAQKIGAHEDAVRLTVQ